MSAIEIFLRFCLGIGLIWFILFFLTLIHEYGHVVVCDALGIKVDKVVVGWPVVYRNESRGLKHEIGVIPVFGYVAAPSLVSRPVQDRALLAAAGPLASILLGLVLLAVDWVFPVWLINVAGHGSLTLAAVNLIPLPPFDGWPICQYFLSKCGVEVSDKAQRVLMVAGAATIGLSVLVVDRFGGL